MSMHLKSKQVQIAILAALMATPAFAEQGGGSTGGGQAGENGELFDFYETQVDPLQGAKPFDPLDLPAVQNRLIPLVRKLDEKAPGAAIQFMKAFNANGAKWYLVDQPIADSNDECVLLKSKNKQVAKQVEGTVVVDRKWLMQEADSTNQAGLIAHEAELFNSGKGPADCSTKVRDFVRSLFKVDQLSEKEAAVLSQNTLPNPSPSLKAPTKSEFDAIRKLFVPAFISEDCVKTAYNGTITPELHVRADSPNDISKLSDYSLILRFIADTYGIPQFWLSWNGGDQHHTGPDEFVLGFRSIEECESSARKLREALEQSSADRVRPYLRNANDIRAAQVSEAQNKTGTEPNPAASAGANATVGEAR